MMTVETKKYVRRPFYVDAVQVTEENIQAVATWCGGEVRDAQTSELGETNHYVKVRVYRPMNDRQSQAFVGDWILFAGTGYKVYTARAFEKNFKLDSEKTYRDAGTGEFVSEEFAEENPTTTVSES